MINNFALFSLLGLLTAIGCSFSFGTKSSTIGQAVDAEGIREVILIHELRKLTTDTDTVEPPIFCVGIERDENPSDQLLKILASHGFNVRKFHSDCSRMINRGDPVGHFVDSKTGKDALLVYIQDMQWLNGQTVFVKVENQASSLNAAVKRFKVVKQGSRWIIKGYKVLAIS